MNSGRIRKRREFYTLNNWVHLINPHTTFFSFKIKNKDRNNDENDNKVNNNSTRIYNENNEDNRSCVSYKVNIIKNRLSQQTKKTWLDKLYTHYHK